MRSLKLITIFIASVALFVIAACSGGNTSKSTAKIDTVIEANYRKAYYYDFNTSRRLAANFLEELIETSLATIFTAE